MGRPKGAKNKQPKYLKQSKKVFPVRLYEDLQEYVDSKPNKNEYFNMLVRKDFERYKRQQAKEVQEILNQIDESLN
jgi:hypothetical protein